MLTAPKVLPCSPDPPSTLCSSGYLLTAPKVLQAGTDERACLSLYHLPGPYRTLSLKFFERNVPSSIASTLNETDFLLFESAVTIPDDVGGACSCWTEMRLQLLSKNQLKGGLCRFICPCCGCSFD